MNPPALQSRSRSCTSILGELLLRCVVSHRIAPGEFLSGGFYVQAPFSFTLPVELCSGRPNCGATQSFGEKLCLGSSCDCSSPGLQVGWLGRKPAACLFLEFLSLFWGTCALVSLLKTDLSQCSGSSCGRAQESSFFPCLLFAGLRSEVSFSPWQSHHSSKRQPWHPSTVWFSLGTTKEEWSASS